MTDFLLLRSFYQYYYDNFGIHAHTTNLEVSLNALGNCWRNDGLSAFMISLDMGFIMQ